MKSGKRKVQPLNFTPDPPPRARPGAEDWLRAPTPPVAAPPPRAPAPARAPRRDRAPAPQAAGLGQHAYLIAFVGALAWAGMLFAYTIGYVGGIAGLMRAPMQLAVVTLMAVLPAVFVFAAAFAVKQAARLAGEAQRMRAASEDMLAPAVMAAGRAGDLVAALRGEIERATAAADVAREGLASMREGLASEGERLNETAADAQRAARVVGETLARERDGVAALLQDLQAQAEQIGHAMERQGRLVGEASDLARAQLDEAQATLAVGATRLTEAGGQAGANVRAAGQDLARQVEQLDSAAAALSERLRFLEARLSEQRAALGAVAQHLESDQDDVAARLETHRAQLLEVIIESRASAAEIGVAAAEGGQALRDVLAASAEEGQRVAEGVRRQQEELRAEALEARMDAQNELHRALDTLSRMGEDARRSLAADAEQASAQAGARLAAARAEVEQLGELAFAAGQRADQAFQGRIAELRRAGEQAAAEVEQAITGSTARIETSLAAGRGALGELATALGDLDGRLERLPEQAQRQVQAIRSTAEQALQDLAAAARHAASETQAIDAAFQDRIKRNYETLSEAVRLMGRAASESAPQSPAPEPPRAAAAAAAAEPAEPTPAAAVKTPAPAAAKPFWSSVRAPTAAAYVPTPPLPAEREDEALEPAEMLLEPMAASAETAPRGRTSEAALRPRLKLTPTEGDRALQELFAPAAEPTAAAQAPNGGGAGDGEPDTWTWRDLLTSMEVARADVDTQAERMVSEIAQLGIDAAALLPPQRLEDVAAAFEAGDLPAGRDRVRRVAPAAIRRLSRRVLTDPTLREQADRFAERYRGLVRGARDEAGGAVAELLSNEAGRAYLLLEAAVGEL